MRNILVTGGAGNVGGSLVKRLVQNENNFVVIIDNLVTGSKSKLPSTSYNNWLFINCDVNRLDELSVVMATYQFEIVFHYAALVGVKRTLENPISVLNDIKGIENILTLSKNTGVKRVFYSSSSEVYGEPVSLPQIEDVTPLNSKLPYAIVKNVGEAYFKSFKSYFDLDFTIFRFFNTYGPNQSEDFVVKRFLEKAKLNQDITVYGDGLQTRTFCFIDDNINATLKALDENLGVNETINIGSDKEITILELAQICIEKTKSKSKIVHLPPLPEGDMTRRKPDLNKMKKILLYRPQITIEQGIEKMLSH
jgi:nucleoside-diphosphate-sugar epimerase